MMLTCPFIHWIWKLKVCLMSFSTFTFSVGAVGAVVRCWSGGAKSESCSMDECKDLVFMHGDCRELYCTGYWKVLRNRCQVLSSHDEGNSEERPQLSFYYVYAYQIIPLYTLNVYIFIKNVFKKEERI